MPEAKPQLKRALGAWDLTFLSVVAIANLNLVFQPRTGPEARPDAAASDREIELILGPLTITNDFTDLLENKPAGR